jgi:hypothetical protein
MREDRTLHSLIVSINGIEKVNLKHLKVRR